MVTLDAAARGRLREAKEAAGHSIQDIQRLTSNANGTGGIARSTLYRLFDEGDDPVQIQEAILSRLAVLYRGVRTEAKWRRWIVKGQDAPTSQGSRRFQRPKGVYAIGAGVVGLAAVLLIGGPRSGQPQVEVDGSTIRVRQGRLNPIYQLTHDSRVAFNAIAPWSGDPVLVYGLWAGANDGGEVRAVDLRNRKLLWKMEPDLHEVREVFGEEMGAKGAFRCGLFEFADLDGDGVEELIVHRYHDRWFPASVTAYRRDGSVLGTYYNWGQIYDLHCDDVDFDGRQDVLISGTNNAKCYQGATIAILDAEHFHGASVDSLVNPTCFLQDSSCVRVVLPHFGSEFVRRPFGVRLSACDLETSRNADGTLVITATVGETAVGFVMTFDGNLEPKTISPSDLLLEETREWPADLRARFFDPGHLSQWSARFQQFGALASHSSRQEQASRKPEKGSLELAGSPSGLSQ